MSAHTSEPTSCEVWQYADGFADLYAWSIDCDCGTGAGWNFPSLQAALSSALAHVSEPSSAADTAPGAVAGHTEALSGRSEQIESGQ